MHIEQMLSLIGISWVFAVFIAFALVFGFSKAWKMFF